MILTTLSVVAGFLQYILSIYANTPSETEIETELHEENPVSDSEEMFGRGRGRGRGRGWKKLEQPGISSFARDQGVVASMGDEMFLSRSSKPIGRAAFLEAASTFDAQKPSAQSNNDTPSLIPSTPFQDASFQKPSASQRSKTNSDRETTVDLSSVLFELWDEQRYQDTSFRFRGFLTNSLWPLTEGLSVLRNLPDRHLPKTTTSYYFILKELDSIAKKQPEILRRETITEELRMNAFMMATNKERKIFAPVFERICTVYQIMESSHLAIPFINKLINGAEPNLKDAALIVNSLRLHSEFDIENQFIIPLLVSDKVNVLETLVQSHKPSQKLLIDLLDKWSATGFDLGSLIEKTEIKANKTNLSHRTIRKHGARLMKKYHITISDSNISKSQNMASVRHLLYRHYKQKNLAYDNWKELTRAALMSRETTDSEQEQLADFVNLLASYDVEEAYNWYNELKIDSSLITDDVLSFQPRYQPADDVDDPYSGWGQAARAKSYYKLPLPYSHITVVDTPKLYMLAIESLTQPNILQVGIDCEWRPVFGSSTDLRIATVQLSSETHVYILDMITLKQYSNINWSLLVEDLFMNPEILKLGYGFSADMRVLHKTLQEFGSRSPVNVLELDLLQAKVMREESTPIPNSGSKGLGQAVEMYLGGLELDKTEQVSDWERRPLRESQILYAATDAYCLIELYKILAQKSQYLNIDVDSLHHTNTPKSNKKTKAKSKKPKKSSKSAIIPPYPTYTQENTVESIKFIVSNMLQGLGRQLRLLGIDVYISGSSIDGVNTSSDDHDDAVSVSLRDNRIVLTSGRPYDRLKSLVGANRCYNINTELSARDQSLSIVKYFNITVKHEDVFSRCQTCNNAGYIMVGNKSVRSMFSRFAPSNQPSPNLQSEEQWAQIKPATSINEDLIQLDNGVPLQLDPVTNRVLSFVDKFYCCSLCGKVFWEGSHYHRVYTSFSEILTEPVGSINSYFNASHQPPTTEQLVTAQQSQTTNLQPTPALTRPVTSGEQAATVLHFANEQPLSATGQPVLRYPEPSVQQPDGTSNSSGFLQPPTNFQSLVLKEQDEHEREDVSDQPNSLNAQQNEFTFQQLPTEPTAANNGSRNLMCEPSFPTADSSQLQFGQTSQFDPSTQSNSYSGANIERKSAPIALLADEYSSDDDDDFIF